ncbi:MAG TPA: hypothetical protein VK968_16240 [Roseimicrobium sp.]|nr:hypothetical protein [Roseimicrobium sp.]
MKKWLPWILTLFFAAWIVSELRAPKDKSYQFAEFGRLPVVANGRFQPMDSLARNALLQLREKQSVYVPFTAEELQQRSGIKRMMDAKTREMPAIEWLSELIFAPEKADTRKVFRVDHPEVRSMLKLPEKDEAAGEDGKHYSWNQFTNSLEIMQKESKRVGELDSSHRTPFDQAVAKTHKRLVTYMQLKNMIQPQDARDFSAELADYSAIIVPGVAAIRAQQAGKEYDQPLYERFLTYAQRFDAMARMEPPLVVPPHHPEKERDAWMRMGEALLEMARGEPQHPAALAYATMASSFRQGKVADFNQAVLQYRGFLETGFAPELKKTGREQVYNRLQAFYHSMVIYIVAFLLAVFSWFNLSEALRKSAAKLIGLALIIHTAGLIFRMVLEGRPPVTNL